MSPGVGEVGAVLRAVAEWREASIAVREAMEQRASERNAAQDRMYAAYDALCALSPAHLRALAAQADAGAGDERLRDVVRQFERNGRKRLAPYDPYDSQRAQDRGYARGMREAAYILSTALAQAEAGAGGR